MPEQIYIGNFAKGLTLNREPFAIDNDAFPVLFNFYCWRGRVKRKRGTGFLGQLELQVSLVSPVTKPWQKGPLTLSSGEGNLLTFLSINPTPNAITGITQANPAVVTIVGHTFSIGDVVQIVDVTGMTQLNGNYYTITNKAATTITLNVDSTLFSAYTGGGNAYLANGATITPDSISLTDGVNTYTDPNMNGTLVGSPAGTGTINYATGEITIAGGGGSSLTGSFDYYPALPVMGLKDFVAPNISALYPVLLAFDTEKSYQIRQQANTSSFFYNVTYYKTTNVPFSWSGADYQQFWTTNYSGALWATNNVPGLNFVNGTYVSGSPSTDITFTFTSGGNPFQTLLVGDVLWFNEWATSTGLNGISGTVSVIVNAGLGQYTVHFATSVTVSGTGIAQLMTNTIPGQDGIKWYDGDPTSGTGIPTGTTFGWVNFAPPLSATTVAIDNHPARQYYLVGALAILPFKDRLLFFSPYIQASNGVPIQLKDTVLWSWNGTPYYSNPVPADQTVGTSAGQTGVPFYVDQTGLGGYLSAGISQPITTVSNNEDVLLIGFGGDGRKTRFVYTGNDLQPFLFFNINSELPSSATFSSIALDKGAIDIGQYGIALTDQQSSQRIDVDIPDSVFQIQSDNNGVNRVNAIRDFLHEWIYFSYPVNNSSWKFPTQTFLFNYRDNTWSILYENYTARGRFRPQFKRTWKTIGQQFGSWANWREPWNGGITSTLYPNIIAGNPQGYVLIQSEGTGEAPSGTVDAISETTSGLTQITSYNHCVKAGDFLLFLGVLGLLTSSITAISKASQAVITTVNTFVVNQFVTISGVVGMTQLNGNTYQIVAVSGTSITINVDSTNFSTYVSGGTVTAAFNGQIGKVASTIDANNFIVDISYPTGLDYVGLGTFTRLSQPLFLTKQFNPYWQEGRKTRLALQKYLLDTTANSQVTVNIYLSQDQNDVWNDPNQSQPTNALIYSQLMYTCPESTNIGLTPANTNLQMPTAAHQAQIWHRFNTSLIGDSVQIGITLNDAQMKNLTYATSEVTLHGIQLTVDRSSLLA